MLLIALAITLGVAGAASGEANTASARPRPTAHVVFQNNRDGDFDIYAVNPDGSRLAALTRTRVGEYFAALSPNGRYVATERLSAQRMVLIGANGRETRLGFGEPLAFSPNSKRLAFQWRRLFGVVGINGRGRRILTTESIDEFFDWSPDGRSVLLGASEEIDDETYDVLLDVDTTGRRAPRALARDANDADWGRNGLVAYGSSQEVVVLDPERPQAPVFVARAHVDNNEEGEEHEDEDLQLIGWSPDGHLLAYTRSRDFSSNAITIVDVASAKETVLTRVNDFDGATWSPKSDALAISGDDLGVVVVGVNGRVRGRIRRGAYGYNAVAWSPRGDRIAFPGRSTLFSARPDGSQLVGLTRRGETYLLGWARGPVPSSAPRPRALPQADIVRGGSVRALGPITELAADGQIAAALVRSSPLDCSHVVAWQVGKRRAVRFGFETGPCDESPSNFLFGLDVHGTQASWSDHYCGNFCYVSEEMGDLQRPNQRRVLSDDEVDWRARPRPRVRAQTRQGVHFSLHHGTIVLRRVSDRGLHRIRPPGGAVDAELENTGLFYAYNTGGRYRGHVAFVPFRRLFVR